MSKFTHSLFMPKHGRMRIPTALVTVRPFDRCPSCDAERSDVTRDSIIFACGMTQTQTDGDEFAVSSCCPYAMAAVHELRARKLARGEELPASLASFATEKLERGDKVKWTSQSAGKETVKKGIIVAVVPPDARPEGFIPDGLRRNSTNGYGRNRNHVSYLVRVKGKGTMVYWPRVHCLEKL